MTSLTKHMFGLFKDVLNFEYDEAFPVRFVAAFCYILVLVLVQVCSFATVNFSNGDKFFKI